MCRSPGQCGWWCLTCPALVQAHTPPLFVQVENEELRHLLWSSVVFYQTPGLEVTACVLLSTKAVYFVLHDGLRRYFSEPLQGRTRLAVMQGLVACMQRGCSGLGVCLRKRG